MYKKTKNSKKILFKSTSPVRLEMRAQGSGSTKCDGGSRIFYVKSLNTRCVSHKP